MVDAALTPAVQQALLALLQRLADEKLALGHRDSEWLGYAPHIEEDVAWASIAQDEIGHGQLYLQLMHQLGAADPDTLAFGRYAQDWRCADFAALPNGDFARAAARHFLYDHYDAVQLAWLQQSTWQPLADVARKVAREERYHLVHFPAWVTRLAAPGSEARQRLTAALHDLLPAAAGLFETTEAEAALVAVGVLPAVDLKGQWLAKVCPTLAALGLPVPGVQQPDGTWTWQGAESHLGGRRGQHTPDLTELLNVMCEVWRLDPAAKW
jgi:ring-1,2-phenylacetyl-CoA epoxidase subunit PaaC